MPWQPLPRIAFAIATYPFAPSSPADLPLEIGDELYVIEETPDGNWLRGYLVAPPSLLAGLTSVKGQTLEARVFSGIFPRSCVEVRELLGESGETDDEADPTDENAAAINGDGPSQPSPRSRKTHRDLANNPLAKLSIPVTRDPSTPRPPAPVPMLKVGDETPTSASEPLIDEIGSCLREWHSTNLHELLLTRQYDRLNQLSQLISDLDLSRQQFLYNVLTAHEYDRLREKTVWDLVKVNKLCGGDVIVRDPQAQGRVLTGDDSAVEITQLQSVMSLLDEPPQTASELSTRHHLYLDVKGFAGSSSEETSLLFSLVSKSASRKLASVSEPFMVDVAAGGTLEGLAQHAQTSTLFADIAPHDIGDAPSSESELYLVVKIVASQHIAVAKPASRTGTGPPNGYGKENVKPPSAPGAKSSRRSFMWASKTARSAISRGTSGKMESVNEHSEQRPATDDTDNGPPSTAGTRTGGQVSDTQVAQRTLGVGVLKLNNVVKQDEESEQVVSMWSRTPKPTNEADYGDDWDPIIREIMDSPMNQYEKSNRGERLQIYLRSFSHPDADALIKATPTLLSGVSKTNRMGFSGAPSKPRSDIYLTINQATLARQNLLSRYGGSATPMPASTQGINFQLTAEVRLNSGERIENCIYASSNGDALTTFKSVAVERGEAWGQILRLSLSPSDVCNAHVVLFLCDMPNPPFAVAHIPLWDQQAFVRDGTHGLLLYKIDEHTSTPLPGPVGKGGYLSLPWTPRGNNERSAEVTGPLVTLFVDTYLCSTKFSQDRVVLGLLRWKDTPRDNIPPILRQLIFVPEIEVVKLLSDVLNGLFGILVEYSGNDEYEDLVFTALVRVLDIVHDRRFNLGPIVDRYAENEFNFPFATPCLVRSFTRLLENPTEPETARKLRATFKVVRHILKFITHSRGQQKVKEAGIGLKSSTTGFSRHLRSIFKALDAMMRNTSPVLVGSQTLAVQHFHTWLPELVGLLSAEEILHIAIDFVDSCADVKGKLVLYKLILIINYSKIGLFSDPEQRSVLVANTVRWITPHWGHASEINDQWRAQIRLCCSVLASQIDYLGLEVPKHIPGIIDSYLALLAVEQKPRNRLSLLFPTSYPFPSKTMAAELTHDEALAELAAVLSAISTSAAGMQLDELVEDDLAMMLENLLQVHLSILNGEAFPQDWLSVRIYQHKSTMRALQYIADLMLESFMPDPEDAEGFNTELWKMFFTTLLKLVGSPSLALETFPEQKRRAIWKIAGDVREHGAELLRTTWEAIGWDATPEEQDRYGLERMGGYQVQYVPTLVGPIVELCLSVHEGLRKMAVEVLQTMIVSEWALSEDLSAIQTEVIDCLDNFFKTKPLTESIVQKLFVSELLERFGALSESDDEPLYDALQEFVGTVDEFLDLLTAVHSSDSTNDASHLISQLRLMEFLRDMQKEEIFVRYVHQLADFQAATRNHTEAGLALRLHADLYDWDPTKQATPLLEPYFPSQTAFERKEKIYFDMIKHFEDGESWSNALTAYKELQTQYETNVFDFAKLARTQRAIATIYETISKSDRASSKYFKVVFKGLGFPASVRDKEFIYEGALREKGSAFTDRMQEQYPNARIVASGDVDEVEGQYLVISNVTPHRDLGHPVYQRTRVAQVIRDFVLSSHPQTFTIMTKRVTQGPVHEHYSEKTVYTTAEPFPTILRRSEVIEQFEITLTAHETALERIVRKTQEMTALERRVAEGDEENAALLLDAISVSVNPNSEHSVSCYRQLLPQPKRQAASDLGSEERDDDDGMEDEEEVEAKPQDVALKMALVDHAIMIKRCLATFARSDNALLRHRHEELQSYFETTFEPEVAVFSPPQPLREYTHSVTPTWRAPSSPNGTSTPTPGIASVVNGVRTEEASVARPVSLHQRSKRLSFLNKRRMSDGHRDSAAFPPSIELPASPRSRAMSKDTTRRGSFFRAAQSNDELSRHFSGDEAAAAAGAKTTTTITADLRRPSQASSHDLESEGSGGPGLIKKTSVRKRLSMLKLGGKRSRNATMSSLDEE